MADPNLENPMGAWGTTLPTLFTASYQTRQYGVGGASTYGQPPSIIAALKTPPAAMTTAVNSSAAKAIGFYVVTLRDKETYRAG